jgi:hypothetical protein
MSPYEGAVTYEIPSLYTTKNGKKTLVSTLPKNIYMIHNTSDLGTLYSDTSNLAVCRPGGYNYIINLINS